MAIIKRGAIVEHALLSTAETYSKVKVTMTRDVSQKSVAQV